ncbi:hypothetical protein [Defluviimonas salinarum]|uniref:HepT-like domain-containing protein n=1 Tax=Defluviimonas salinarum TaxID=2992147 RepID=A0ABT3J5G7_9RHOB|nr:hypothetical protein [Defluviimonas salinarum]MCW3782918.1 hypothetical protein [Defluviimonas salinarum]
MLQLRLPALSSIPKKLEDANTEMGNLERFLSRDPFKGDDDVMRWSALTTAATAVHNVYNGIEDALKVIARNVDRFVPEGPTSHQDLLDAMRSAIEDVRPEVIGDALHADLSELKQFRHRVNHNYAYDLREGPVMDNVVRLRRAFPEVLEAVRKLDEHLAPPPPPPPAAGDETPPDPFSR